MMVYMHDFVQQGVILVKQGLGYDECDLSTDLATYSVGKSASMPACLSQTVKIHCDRDEIQSVRI
jgi:hypothetical protein